MAKRKPRVHMIPRKLVVDLRELFEYSAEKKGLVWKRTRGVHGVKGNLAGTTPASGKRTVKLNYELYYMDDLVWYWHHGEFSKHPLIHIDGDLSNCAIENLKQDTSIVRPHKKDKEKPKSKEPVSGEDKDTGVMPEDKLVAAIIKNALWYAKKDVETMDGPFDEILEKSEPCQFLTGQDERLEFLTSASLLDADTVIRMAYKELEKAYDTKRV